MGVPGTQTTLAPDGQDLMPLAQMSTMLETHLGGDMIFQHQQEGQG